MNRPVEQSPQMLGVGGGGRLGVTCNGLASHPEGEEILQKDSGFEGTRANERLRRDFTLPLHFTQGKFNIVFNNLLSIFSFIYSTNFN